MSTTFTLSFDLQTWLSYAFLGFLANVGTKFVCALSMFLFRPKLDGVSLFAFGAVLLNLQRNWFISLLAAVGIALVFTLVHQPLVMVLSFCAVPAAISALLTGFRTG